MVAVRVALGTATRTATIAATFTATESSSDREVRSTKNLTFYEYDTISSSDTGLLQNH